MIGHRVRLAAKYAQEAAWTYFVLLCRHVTDVNGRNREHWGHDTGRHNRDSNYVPP